MQTSLPSLIMVLCFVTACVGPLPPHSYSFEPSAEFVSAAEQGCEWEASWNAFHSTHHGRFASCMAFLGLRRGGIRSVMHWAPPANGADRSAQMVSCAKRSLAELERLDQCMLDAGFDWVPGEFIPYRKPGQLELAQSKKQLKGCTQSRPFEGFEREIGICLQSHGWTWEH